MGGSRSAERVVRRPVDALKAQGGGRERRRIDRFGERDVERVDRGGARRAGDGSDRGDPRPGSDHEGDVLRAGGGRVAGEIRDTVGAHREAVRARRRGRVGRQVVDVEQCEVGGVLDDRHNARIQRHTSGVGGCSRRRVSRA